MMALGTKRAACERSRSSNRELGRHRTRLDETTTRSRIRRDRRLEELITKGSDTKVEPGTSDEELINMVAQHLPMGLAERQGLLELRNVLLRVRALIELIESKAKPRAVASASLPY